jgi:crotonobetainyl-CoA:carnitine CoA-transferase CaiB-like acyl-CoA transferase
MARPERQARQYDEMGRAPKTAGDQVQGRAAGTPPGILEGVRVVDCTDGIAGPVAALLLAEAGAEVVKIERPDGGPARRSLGFATWNRSKLSMVLDLDHESDRHVLDRLLARSDVLLHPFGPQRATALGLADHQLAARHPQLVVAAVTAWPGGHPSAEGPADDLLVTARLGLCDEQTGHRPGPVFLRFPFGSWCAAYLSAIGVLARLVQRERGGASGGPAHTSLAQGALLPTMMHWARAEAPGPSFAVGLPKDMVPTLFECADGRWVHLMRCADNDSPLMAKALADLGPAGVARENARFAGLTTMGYPNFGANRAAFLTRPSHEWLADFWANDIPAQPAAEYGEILADAQAAANGYVVEIDDPLHGRVVQAGTPFTTNPPSAVRRPAPALDQDGPSLRAALATDLPGSTPAPGRPARAPGRPARAPLEGVRVLDFGNFLAGPLGPMLLADLGADVVKVEATTGDRMRRVERAFAACQRGKRGVALDLTSPAARPALAALVRWADVVHHNLRMPAARRLGVDYESIRAINPEVVYCHASSYGPNGERADWPGYDQLFQAAAGWEVLGGGDGNDPMWFRFGFMDHLCATASVVATLLALYHRDRTGRGQMVTSSLLGAAVLTNSETFLRDGALAGTVPPLDQRQTGLSSGYRLYRAADAWLALCAQEDEQLEAACRSVGAHHPEVLEERLAAMTVGEALAALSAAGVPCEPVLLDQGEAFLDDPSHRALGLVAEYQQVDWGRMTQIGAFWQLGELQPSLRLAPPGLGEHTVAVLTEVGLEASAIEGLLAEGVAVQWPG